MLFLVFAGNVAFAQANVFGQLPATGWQKSMLSKAVLNDARQASIQAFVASQSGTLTPDVVENAAESLKVLFDHFQEIGLNAAMQKELLSNQKAFIDFQPSDSQIAAEELEFASEGMHVSDAQVRSVMDPSLEQRQQFLFTVQQVGLYRTELMLVAQLRARAEKLSAETRIGERSAGLFMGNARLVEATTVVCESCFIGSGLSIIVPEILPGAFFACLGCALGG
ncbi:MAG: hypothetical protein ACP5M4_11010 [Acidobacteriaceae bacterium]